MKRLNNKGFAISTILYGLLVVTILLSVTVMSTMSFNRKNSKEFVNTAEEQLEKVALLKLTIRSGVGALEKEITEICRVYGDETTCSIPLKNIQNNLKTGFTFLGYDNSGTALTPTYNAGYELSISRDTIIYVITKDTVKPKLESHTPNFSGDKYTKTAYTLTGKITVCDNSTTLTRDTSKVVRAYIGDSTFYDKYSPNQILYTVDKNGTCSTINYTIYIGKENIWTGALTLNLEEGFFKDSSENKNPAQTLSTGVSFTNKSYY